MQNCIKCGAKLDNPNNDIYCRKCRSLGKAEDAIKMSYASTDMLKDVTVAVVKKASDDYLEILRFIRDYGTETDQDLIDNVFEIKRNLYDWFYSPTFNLYTMGAVNPDYILRIIHKEFDKETQALEAEKGIKEIPLYKRLNVDFAVWRTIAEKIIAVMNFTADDQFETIHNYIDHSSNIIRKDAIPAKRDREPAYPNKYAWRLYFRRRERRLKPIYNFKAAE